MSDAARMALYSLEESTEGTTPASAMNTAAHVTSVTGGLTRQTARTASLRSDYVRPDTVQLTDGGELASNFELAYGDVPIADWFEGVFRTDWSTVVSVTGTDVSFTSPDTIASTSTDLSVFAAGRQIRLAGAGAGANAGKIVQVSSSTTTSITLTSLVTVGTQAAGGSVTIDNDGSLRHGTTKKSYSLERNFADLSATPFLVQVGMVPSAASLDISQAIVTGSVQFMGRKPSDPAAATAGTGAANAATTNKPMNGTGDISGILENGTAIAADVSQITLNYGAGVRLRHKLGQVGPFGTGLNAFDWSGTLNVYNDDDGLALYLKELDFTSTSLYFNLTDAAGNILRFSFPKVYLIAGNPDNSGPDSDIYIPFQFAVDKGASPVAFLAQIDRFAAA